jgi:hypothetical protein
LARFLLHGDDIAMGMSRRSVAEIERIDTMPEAPGEDLEPLPEELIAGDQTQDRLDTLAPLDGVEPSERGEPNALGTDPVRLYLHEVGCASGITRSRTRWTGWSSPAGRPRRPTSCRSIGGLASGRACRRRRPPTS